ncbi:MAG: zf-HC2 domain-containing protein, partial [Chloroflexi bacterium]|nr:zf-HC2 domain-containing protein [Chloroflexota bacterium]
MFFWRKHPIRDVDLSAYVDGQLEPPARDRLEAHIETCTPCREALAELRALRSALQELPPATAPRSFALREADVRAEAKPSLTPARPPALLGGLASVALVAFVALVGVDVLGQPSAQRDADATGIMSPEGLEEDADLKISTTGSTGD